MAKDILANAEASEKEVKSAVEGLKSSLEKLEAKVTDTIEANKDNIKESAVNTKDTTNTISALGLMTSLSAAAYFSRKRKK